MRFLPSEEAKTAASTNGEYSDRELVDRAVQIIEHRVAEGQLEVEYREVRAGAPSTYSVCGEMRIRALETDFRRFVVWPDKDDKYPWDETVSLEPEAAAIMNKVFLLQWSRCRGQK